MPTPRRWSALLGAVALAGTLLTAPALAASSSFIVQGAGAAAAVEAAGGHVTRSLDLVGGVAATLSEPAAERLAVSGFGVAPDAPAHVTSADFSTDPQLDAVDPGTHWDLTAGAGVGVALVDTGVAETPDLQGRLVRGVDLSGEDDGADHYGHGTFMAGLIAGDGSASSSGGVRHVGVAPAATVVSVKVAGADGSTTTSSVIAGIAWAVDHADELNIRVLNLSVGVPPQAGWRADPLSAAVEMAWASGITVVVAAGNDGPGTVTSPGRDPWVITAGALDTDGGVAPFSGASRRGPSPKPDVLAPGVSVVSLRAPGSTVDREHPDGRVGDDYFRGSGTSMATAMTAGAAAVLVGHHPEAAPDDVKGALVATARDVPGSRAGAVDLGSADETAAADWDQHHPAATGDEGDGEPVEGMPWTATRWSATRWSATRWSATRWSATRWSATRWSATRWSATRWSATRWSATRWSATRWSATRWSATRWSSTRWSDAAWGGSG